MLSLIFAVLGVIGLVIGYKLSVSHYFRVLGKVPFKLDRAGFRTITENGKSRYYILLNSENDYVENFIVRMEPSLSLKEFMSIRRKRIFHVLLDTENKFIYNSKPYEFIIGAVLFIFGALFVGYSF